MNAIQPAFAHKLEAIADTFTVWRVTSMDWHNAEPAFVDAANDLDAAIEAGLMATPHKDHFFIRHTAGLSGITTLRFYTVKQRSKPVHVRASASMAHTIQARPKYAEALFNMREPGK